MIKLLFLLGVWTLSIAPCLGLVSLYPLFHRQFVVRPIDVLNMAPPNQPPAVPEPATPAAPPKREAPISVPTVGGPAGQVDVLSRLVKDRIVILGSEVNDEVANNLVSQLLYLASEIQKKI